MKNKSKDTDFSRSNPFAASIRRKDENDRSFSNKNRRVKSIEQGLNKSWSGKDPYRGGYYWSEGFEFWGFSLKDSRLGDR